MRTRASSTAKSHTFQHNKLQESSFRLALRILQAFVERPPTAKTKPAVSAAATPASNKASHKATPTPASVLTDPLSLSIDAYFVHNTFLRTRADVLSFVVVFIARHLTNNLVKAARFLEDNQAMLDKLPAEDSAEALAQHVIKKHHERYPHDWPQSHGGFTGTESWPLTGMSCNQTGPGPRCDARLRTGQRHCEPLGSG
jgi:hypothetical protein